MFEKLIKMEEKFIFPFIFREELLYDDNGEKPATSEMLAYFNELDLILEIEKTKDEINKAIQNHLDSKAQEFRYDNMMSARSYTGYENPFQAEAQRLAVWAANCWVKAGEIEADILAGNRTAPTLEQVMAEMPLFV